MRRVPFLTLPLALLASALAPQAASAALKLPKCGANRQCGTFKVPVDRAGKVPGSLGLAITRFTPRKATKPPLFALAGGPGQPATSLDDAFAEDFKAARADRDLIVFDQRGTGSSAINCPALQKDERDSKAQAACVKQLGATRAFYTTPDSVDDIEAIRTALGAPTIALYGVSYGTNVAVSYALKYPARVERLVLDSVLPPEGQTIFEEDAIAALPRVLAAECAGKCGAPDIAGDFVKAIRAMPLKGTYVDDKGRRKTDTVTARRLFDDLRQGDTDAGARLELPAAVAAAARGDAAPLLRMRHRFDGAFSGAGPVEPIPASEQSSGLYAATVCEEGQLPWDRTTPIADRPALARQRALAQGAKIAPFDAATVLGGDNVLDCLNWPQSPAPPGFGAGPLPDVPVLVLQGEQDLRTPLEAGQAMAGRFPRSQLVAVPNQGHAVVGPRRCVRKAIGAFFADKRVGDPCAGTPPPGGVVPLAPQARPTTPQATADAVAATLADVGREASFLRRASAPVRGGGLRAGRFASAKGGKLTLTGLSYAPGVAVSGTVSGDARASGALKVTSPANSGSLTLKNGVLSGTLGGAQVRAAVRPLKLAPAGATRRAS